MLGLAGVPSVIQAVGILFLPETPIFLYKQGKEAKADKVLAKIYKQACIADKKEEMMQEVESVKEQSKGPLSASLKNLFTTYRRCITIGVGLMFWQ